ncbi:hypothetical protein V3C99_019014 [Haemonchus contortus]|uniref:U20-Nephitoxin-Nsp1a_1 n=1 Tax=Haemonchus contortus TaxID=6289 RepID=A0A7I4YZW3_HAECO
MRSTFLLLILLICALFSYSSASTLCVKLIEKAAYAPGKGTAYDEICKIIGFDD